MISHISRHGSYAVICFEVCLKYQDARLPNLLAGAKAISLIYTDSTAIFTQQIYQFLKAESIVNILPGITCFYAVTSVVAIPRLLATALKQHRPPSVNDDELSAPCSSWRSH